MDKLITVAILGGVVCSVLFAIYQDGEREENKKLQEQESFYQQTATVGKLLRGEAPTLGELSTVGIVRINAPVLDQAITAYLKIQNINSAEPESPARRQIDEFLNYPIKLSPLELPAVKAESATP